MQHLARPTASPPRALVVPRYQRSGHGALDDALQRLTVLWMKSLPEPLRPQQCARRHPRVVNQIAALWGLPQRCIAYLDELQTDRRGNRRGFGLEVTLELQRLRARRAGLAAMARQRAASDFPATQPMGP